MTEKNDRKSFRGFINDLRIGTNHYNETKYKNYTITLGFSLLTVTGQYSSSENLKIYYDFKHIQLDQDYQYDDR